MTRYDQFCAVARAAEIVGERWTLLIVRELLLGPKRFSDLKLRLAPVAPGVLSDRLRSLEEQGLIARREVPPPTPAQLFELTELGRALQPAMRELLRWGARLLFPERPGERFEPEWMAMVLETYAAPAATPAIDVTLVLEAGQQRAEFLVSGGSAGTIISFPAPRPGVARVTAGPRAALGLLSGRMSLEDALAVRAATVEGDLETASRLPELFEMG